jgi:hypothetical protein
MPLANFGTSGFSLATATTAGGHTGKVNDPAWSSTIINFGTAGRRFLDSRSAVQPDATAQATASALSPSGSAFTVAYEAGTPTTTAPPEEPTGPPPGGQLPGVPAQ